jgi:hypothetical protein
MSATVRTGVLALTALVLALVSRHPRAREAAHLVYPMLVAMVVKLLAHDLRVGTSTTLFVDLAVCGAVLILAPKLRAAAPAVERSAKPAQNSPQAPSPSRHDS